MASAIFVLALAASGCSDKASGGSPSQADLTTAMILKAKEINDSAPYLIGELRVERAQAGPGPQLTVFYSVTSIPDATFGANFAKDHEQGNQHVMCRAEATKLHAGARYTLVYVAQNRDPLGTFNVAWKDCIALRLEKSIGQELPFGLFY